MLASRYDYNAGIIKESPMSSYHSVVRIDHEKATAG
ncbi:MAG: hypothetical protein QOD56_960 [Gammaproteobacteria bacterium]|jgi:hypothetical protein|nr:hypothetical protein [Gammaproteobacteria bacterium]